MLQLYLRNEAAILKKGTDEDGSTHSKDLQTLLHTWLLHKHSRAQLPDFK